MSRLRHPGVLIPQCITASLQCRRCTLDGTALLIRNPAPVRVEVPAERAVAAVDRAESRVEVPWVET
jgi:hypothetical protein